MQRNCAVCDAPFEAQRYQAKYCGDTCRKRAQRGGIAGKSETTAAEVNRPVSGLVDAVTAELEAAGKVNSVAGQHALELANRIASAPAMSTGVAALSKQLQSVLAEALRGSGQVADPVDDLKARRDAKRRAG